MEEFAKEELAEAKEETQIEMAAKLLEQGDISEKRVKELFNFTDTQMKLVKEHVAVLA
jgi:hypothetical protein